MIEPRPDDAFPTSPDMVMGLGEGLTVGLRRMALEQSTVVLEGFDLDEDDELLDHAVHRARKAGKRLRALLRLCRFQLGPVRYRWANAIVRDQCRLLSGTRSAAVLKHTLDELLTDTRVGADGVQPLRHVLRERHADALVQLRQDQLGSGAARMALTDLVDRIRTFPPPPEYAARDLAALERGVRRAYRNGRRTMRSAYRLDTAHAFHEWRKKANYLRFQMEALSSVCAPPIAALAEALEELVDVLGSDHDLADLLQAIDGAPVTVPAGLSSFVEARSGPLREHALDLGSGIFANKPKMFLGFFAEQSRPARLG